MTFELHFFFFFVVIYLGAAQRQNYSLSRNASCKTGADLVRALADPAIEAAYLERDISLTEDDWAGHNSGLILERSFTLASPASRPVILNLGFLRSKLRVSANRTLTFQNLVLVHFRSGSSFQAPGLDLLSSLPSGEQAFLHFKDGYLLSPFCFPISVAREALATVKRPLQYGGENVVQLPGPLPLPPSKCSNDTEAYMLERCFVYTGLYVDFAFYGADVQQPGDISKPSGYLIRFQNFSYLCPWVLADDCILKYNPLGCVRYTLFAQANASANRSVSGSGGVRRKQVTISLTCTLGGATVLIMALAVGFLVRKRARQQREQEQQRQQGILAGSALPQDRSCCAAMSLPAVNGVVRGAAEEKGASDFEDSGRGSRATSPQHVGSSNNKPSDTATAVAGAVGIATDATDAADDRRGLPAALAPSATGNVEQQPITRGITAPPATMPVPCGAASEAHVTMVDTEAAAAASGTSAVPPYPRPGSSGDGGSGGGAGTAIIAPNTPIRQDFVFGVQLLTPRTKSAAAAACTAAAVAGDSETPLSGPIVQPVAPNTQSSRQPHAAAVATPQLTGDEGGLATGDLAGEAADLTAPYAVELKPRVLGKGATGRVYEGTYRGRPVAVKVVLGGGGGGGGNGMNINAAAAARRPRQRQRTTAQAQVGVSMVSCGTSASSAARSNSCLSAFRFLSFPSQLQGRVPTEALPVDVQPGAAADTRPDNVQQQQNQQQQNQRQQQQQDTNTSCVKVILNLEDLAGSRVTMPAALESFPGFAPTNAAASSSLPPAVALVRHRAGVAGSLLPGHAHHHHPAGRRIHTSSINMLSISSGDGSSSSSSSYLLHHGDRTSVHGTVGRAHQTGGMALTTPPLPPPPPPPPLLPLPLRVNVNVDESTGVSCGQHAKTPEPPSGGHVNMSFLDAWDSRFEFLFRQEAEVLARCQHPNVVRLLAACVTPPRLCLVMELMETSLEHLIYGSGARTLIPLAKVLHIAAEVCSGLEYLHPTVTHRDLKPANVLLNNAYSATPEVKLSDFGLARIQAITQPTQHPGAGTPAYLAPECYDLDNKLITHHVDMYSLGVLLWVMLTGQRPWNGYPIVAVGYKVTVLKERLPLEQLSNRRCPPKLKQLVRRCWEEDPRRRPAAAEAAKELRALRQQVLGGGSSGSMLGRSILDGFPWLRRSLPHAINSPQRVLASYRPGAIGVPAQPAPHWGDVCASVDPCLMPGTVTLGAFEGRTRGSTQANATPQVAAQPLLAGNHQGGFVSGGPLGITSDLTAAFGAPSVPYPWAVAVAEPAVAGVDVEAAMVEGLSAGRQLSQQQQQQQQQQPWGRQPEVEAAGSESNSESLSEETLKTLMKGIELEMD